MAGFYDDSPVEGAGTQSTSTSPEKATGFYDDYTDGGSGEQSSSFYGTDKEYSEAAALSAQSASNSATAASASATSAAASAAAAASDASEVAADAAAAEAAKLAAQAAQAAAELAETGAETAETNSASSASASSTSATNAANSASSAATSASNASTSASAAATSATDASTSASSAATSATSAATSAGTATTQATAAAASATSASNSATAAASSASAASTSATNAATSETNAAASAANASTSETNASASETAAAGSATSASTSASNAATSATSASNSASAASTSATNAAASETAAAGSASAASASADAALAALDNFDDRYLGQKASAPTVDNDGDPLVTGALYFDTTDDAMKVWDGTQWLNAYASLSGALIATNNLSDLTNAATARTNLGLGTAATTDSTAYATAAQGALADAALPASSYTAADVLTKVKTVDGAGSGLDADLLDGQQGTYYAAASSLSNYLPLSGGTLTGDLTLSSTYPVIKFTDTDSNPDWTIIGASGRVGFYNETAATEVAQVNSTGINVFGTVTANGLTVQGDATFGDNNKATFGASADLQIYHDGTNSIIQDAGAGSLVLRGASFVLLQSDEAENMVRGQKNAGVDLYYNNASKLTTTSTGIDVTGTVTADGLTVDGVAKVLGVSGNTLIIADSSETNGYALKANTSASVDYGFIIENLSGKDLLKVQSNNDVSFYEDTGTIAKFFWDASAESLGIGTSTPASTLEIVKNDQTNGATLSITNSFDGSGWTAGDTIGTVDFRVDDPSTTQKVRGQIKVFDDASGSTTYPAYSAMSFSTGLINTLNERMRIDSSGNVGIGTTSPQNNSGRTTLTVSHPTNGGVLELYGPAAARQFLMYNSGSDTLFETISGSSGDLVFRPNGSERMRIDSSGNLLVGKSAASLSTAGVTAYGGFFNGLLASVRDGGEPLYLNRLTSDGSIASFQKDGTTVGSIGADAGYLTIGKGDTGLLFQDGGDAIQPRSISGLANRDAAIDLGVSGGRFKNLYLSGGLRGDTLTFGTLAGTERMRIDSAGRVGIGTSSPLARLDVESGTGNVGFNYGTLSSPDRGNLWYDTDGTGWRFNIGKVQSGAFSSQITIQDNGNVGIGTSSPSEKLNVSGNILATGNITAYSDERLKSDIETLDGSKVYQMRGVSYTKDGQASSGVIAQELQKVAPELVSESGEYLSVAYGNLVGYLIEAVKELKAEVEALKGEK